MIETLLNNLQYPFVRYALIAGVLISLSSSLLGIPLVMKQYSFIGSGLSNIAFFGVAMAAAIGLDNNMLLVLPLMVIISVILLRPKQNAVIKNDATLAMLSAGSLATGYLAFNLFSGSGNMSGDVCAVMFGSISILTLGTKIWLVWLCGILSVTVLAVFTVFHNNIFAVTFDNEYVKAAGGRSSTAYNTLISVLIAVVITMAMNLAGALLVSALIVFPAMTAMKLCGSFKAVTICSAAVSVTSAAVGILTAAAYGTPVGATVVGVNITAYLLFCAARLIRFRKT